MSTTEALKIAVQEAIDRRGPELIEVATTILQHPEPGFREQKTSQLVARKFRDFGIPFEEGIALTGLKGMLETGNAGPGGHLEARRQRNGGARIDVSGVSAGQVAGHPVLLGQAVRNLLANAVRHARGRVTVTLDERDDRVLLVVDDDGPGIPEEERSRVLERFVRLDESRTRDDGGAGLGLAIVSKVVESSGGTVVVGEAPGGGARLTVSLPAVAPGT